MADPSLERGERVFIFLPQYGFTVRLGQLIVLATTSNKEAERKLSISQSETNARVERVIKSFWATIELLEGPDSDPNYGRMLEYQLIVQDYLEAVIFESTERAAMTYKANRKDFYAHRASLRTCESHVKICKIDPKLIREHAAACLRKN